MALTLTRTKDGRWGRGTGDKQYWFGTATFDSLYATGGESLTPADLGMSTFTSITANSEDGFDFRYDYSGELLLAYEGYGGSTAIGTVGHDASAATNGADTQIAIVNHIVDVVEENGWNSMIGSFEAVCASNATIHDNQVGTSASAANPLFTVWDEDGAEDDTTVMIDLFIDTGSAGYNANNRTAGQDIYVPTSTGIFIPVVNDETPNGVQTYFDDNGADAALTRQLGVIADAGNEFYSGSAKIGMQADSGNREIAHNFNLSAAVVRIAAFGTPADTPF